MFDLDADRLCEEVMKSTCNTRKIRDKRDRRHTAGIAISARSCGIIPHVDELYGCESITQIHGSIIEFLGTTSEKSSNLKPSFQCNLNGKTITIQKFSLTV